MIDLIERIEKLTGPDRDVDAAIFEAVTGHSAQTWAPAYGVGGGVIGKRRIGLPEYTRSIEAAMTLVPDGYRVLCITQSRSGEWQLTIHMDAGEPGNPTTKEDGTSYAAQFSSPEFTSETQVRALAFAICAAALRARSSQGTGT